MGEEAMHQERTSIYVYINWDVKNAKCDYFPQLRQLYQIRNNLDTRFYANINIVLLTYVENREHIIDIVGNLVERGDFFAYTKVVFTTKSSDQKAIDVQGTLEMDGTAARQEERSLERFEPELWWKKDAVEEWYNAKLGIGQRRRANFYYYVYDGRIDEYIFQQHIFDWRSQFRTPMYICTYSETSSSGLTRERFEPRGRGLIPRVYEM